MIVWTKDVKKKIIFLDNNMLQYQRDCQMKAFYNLTLGLVQNEHTPATYFGTKYHEVQHVLWGHWVDKIGKLTKVWDLDAAFKVALDYDTSFENADKGKTAERLRKATLEYASYEDEKGSYKEFALENKTLLAEEFISFPITKWIDGKGDFWDVHYCGQIDRVLINSKKEVIVMDYKTTSWNQVMDNVWSHSPQFIGYIWLVEKIFPRYKTNRFLLDLFQMQAKIKNKFVRRFIDFPDWQIAEWEIKRIKEIHRLLDAMAPFEDSPRCTDYGGCPYSALCSHKEHEHPGIESYMFKNIIWNIHGNIPVDRAGLGEFLEKRYS